MTDVLELKDASPERVRTSTQPTSLTDELFGYLKEIKTFCSRSPDEVFLTISSITARLTELKVQALMEGSHKANSVLSKQITPILEELERQFRVHSRLQSVRQQDWDIAKGQF